MKLSGIAVHLAQVVEHRAEAPGGAPELGLRGRSSHAQPQQLRRHRLLHRRQLLLCVAQGRISTYTPVTHFPFRDHPFHSHAGHPLSQGALHGRDECRKRAEEDSKRRSAHIDLLLWHRGKGGAAISCALFTNNC